ncbi:MAG: alpha/beta hydrolase [Rhodospirillales bacterium CG15_BIG_FIL_POST_REV_8_21_14_020_66_15]|nr:MAG: alpha/beta hydrolase [Rhodospirillales bacterium CG15_BIG_FIL_POST_REV_8_21_14_020_66_15]
MPEVIFNGPEGRIEGRYHHAKDPNAPVALLLHPHPEYGGTMNNRVVYAMYQAFVKRGFSTLRFNFRGVGRSQGKFDNGQGELSDAATALDWMQGHNPNASTCWIAGFSFGAWVAMQLMMRRPEISGFISASPPASIYDFSFLAPCPASGLLIHGKADEVVPVGSVDKLVEKLSAQKNIEIDYRTVDKCDHYFSEHLDALLKHVEDYLDKRLVEKAA